MDHTIGSYEAKTKLPEILRAVQSGKRFTITLRGEPVAELVPAQGTKRGDAALAVAEMRRLMDEAPAGRDVDVKALINEGRA